MAVRLLKHMQEVTAMTHLARFYRNDEGQDLIEYALLLGIIAVGVITIVSSIGDKVLAIFTRVDGDLPSVE